MTSTAEGLPDPGPVLVVGSATWDRFEDRIVPGGAITYAALVATAFGIRAHFLVAAGPDADLSALDGHEVHVAPGTRTLVYEHTFSGRRRHLRLLEGPGVALAPGQLPADWPEPRTLILAPLVPGDLHAFAWRDMQSEEAALFGQGLQRSIREDGVVQEAASPSEVLKSALNARMSLFLSSDETESWPHGSIEELAGRTRRVVLTHGRDGAIVHTASGQSRIPAHPANRVDPTGAGDVFAAAFILAVGAGEQMAGRIASAFAAASVERQGPAPLPSLQEIRASLDAPPPGGVTRPGMR